MRPLDCSKSVPLVLLGNVDKYRATCYTLLPTSLPQLIIKEDGAVESSIDLESKCYYKLRSELCSSSPMQLKQKDIPIAFVTSRDYIENRPEMLLTVYRLEDCCFSSRT
uniref:Uncharacterized protein n=1 Tax=Steinernema glaseri TaxID=37863 RepID=A0A1I7Y6I9_9BILA